MPLPQFDRNMPGGRADSLESGEVANFTGGLNLDPNEFRLAKNESPELLNVDISRRGGVEHRKGFVEHTTLLGGFGPRMGDTIDLHPWYGQDGVGDPSGAAVIQVTGLAAGDPVIHFFPLGYGPASGHTFPQDSVSALWSQRRTLAEFEVVPNSGAPDSERLGTTVFAAADGTVVEMWVGRSGSTNTPRMQAWQTALAPSPSGYNDDLDDPKNNRFPPCSVVAAWQGSMWAANVVEQSGTFPSRVRWSHPNHPKDWHPAHYIDLGDDSSGAITALVPDGDRLLVFRERAVHAIVGSPPDALQVYLLTDTLGCLSHSRIAPTEHGVYFWAEERGVFRVAHSKIEWISEALSPQIESGRLRIGSRGELSWGGDRLYLKCEYDGPNGENRHDSWFVFDPTMSKKGVWVQHAFVTDSADEIRIGKSFWFAPPNLEAKFVVSFETDHGLSVRSGRSSADVNGWTTGTNKAVVRTAWHDLGNPGVFKRWRRFDVVGNGLNESQTLTFEGYTDWDSTRRRRLGQVNLNYPREGGAWGEVNWGEFTWGEADLPINVVARTPPLGRARSVQLRFTDDASPSELPWAISSIIAKFKVYPPRG